MVQACFKNQTNKLNIRNEKTPGPQLKKAYILACRLSLILSDQ